MKTFKDIVIPAKPQETRRVPACVKIAELNRDISKLNGEVIIGMEETWR